MPMFGLNGPTKLSAYQPTLRDRAANAMLGMLGNGPLATHFTDGVMGGTGLGRQHMGLVDWVPGVGQAFQADEAGRQMGSGHPMGGLANLALAAIPVPAAAKGLRAVAGEVAPAVRGMIGGAAREAQAAAPIIAYHGSPHTFDQFDTSKIGTGEGAQAYGHGLYFAENEGVAKGYRDALSLPSSPENDVAKFWLQEANGDKQAASAKLREHARDVGLKEHEIAPTLAAIDNGGSMYQVGIKADPDHFLDWDAGLHRQSPHVQEALRKFDIHADPEGMKAHTDALMAALHPDGDASAVLPKEPWDPSGGAIYESSKIVPGGYRDPAAAAQALHEAGIPGIKYKDAGSRAADSGGTHNYVVFSPENIDILKRYGLPAALGAGMAGAAAATPDQAQAAPQPAGMFGSMAPQAPQ